jgi:hypothetical protein
VEILAAYLSPSRPLIGANLSTSFGGRLPVLMDGDLNAKYVDWISRLGTGSRKLLRDYADGNSYLIFGPDSQTTNQYNHFATPDVFDIEISKYFTFPVYLTSYSSLTSDHLPVLIDITCHVPSSTHRIALISGALTVPLPNSLGRSNSVRSEITRRDGNRHVR